MFLVYPHSNSYIVYILHTDILYLRLTVSLESISCDRLLPRVGNKNISLVFVHALILDCFCNEGNYPSVPIKIHLDVIL